LPVAVGPLQFAVERAVAVEVSLPDAVASQR